MLPDNKDQVAGVVLAGGQSSRMGTNKALLSYHGRPLIEFMRDLLHQAGLADVYIGGHVPGYGTIPDKTPYDGPAAAIRNIMERLSGYKGVLFVPVDMPFLSADLLQALMSCKEGAHYESWPLPLYLTMDEKHGEGQAVRQMLSTMNVSVLPVPEDRKNLFLNMNTPEEWQEAVGK